MGTTALGLTDANAAELRGGGALELTIAGFAGMNAHGGDLDHQREDAELGRSLDFSNDTEVHVLARARDVATGLDYGATIEFEADTDEIVNTDETWLFLRGGWGELRLGDVDGPIDASAIGAFTVAAGTGGIDGDIVDALAVDAALPTTTDTATKVRYYTPAYEGVQIGLSYAPNVGDRGDALATTDLEATHWVEVALVYEGELERFDLAASMVGGWGEAKDQGGDGAGAGDLWAYYAGAAAWLSELELGAGFGGEDIGGLRRRYLNAGIGTGIGPVYTSLTYGRVLWTEGYDGVGQPWNLVLSADLDLAEGLVLMGDVAWFANDLDEDARAATGDDHGLVWIARLELAF
jgi:hypothetical protein